LDTVFQCLALSAQCGSLLFQPNCFVFDPVDGGRAARKINRKEYRDGKDYDGTELGERKLSSAFLFQWFPMLCLD
jgi:hypothetical protein